jgi:DNA polymerase-3 subunit alpha
MPDFDIDFCQDAARRGDPLCAAEIWRDQVAQIITFGKLQARAVLRDVGRVLEMPYGQVDRLPSWCPTIRPTPGRSSAGDRTASRSSREAKADEQVAPVDLAMQLEGLYAHTPRPTPRAS